MTDKPTPITEDAERELRLLVPYLDLPDNPTVFAMEVSGKFRRVAPYCIPALLAALDEARARADRAEAAYDGDDEAISTVAFLWREYALCDDALLDPEATEMKRRLLKLFALPAAGQHRERGE